MKEGQQPTLSAQIAAAGEIITHVVENLDDPVTRGLAADVVFGKKTPVEALERIEVVLERDEEGKWRFKL